NEEEIGNGREIDGRSSQGTGDSLYKEAELLSVQSVDSPRDLDEVIFSGAPTIEKGMQLYEGNLAHGSQKIKDLINDVKSAKRKFINQFLNTTSNSFVSSPHSFPSIPISSSNMNNVNPPILSNSQV
ncbi:1617_t:CDS:2, partial [Acaulospora colombiana]